MKTRVNPRALVFASVLIASLAWVDAQQRSSVPVAIDPDDIGGVVMSTNGPEAGVWVIAETSELPTKFARIVVTDDEGRYVLPDLPRATYQIFVRGYGLVDSARVPAKVGQHLDFTALVSPNGCERPSNRFGAWETSLALLGMTLTASHFIFHANCRKKRRSFCTKRRMSGISNKIIASRSIPRPKAKPVHFSGS